MISCSEYHIVLPSRYKDAGRRERVSGMLVLRVLVLFGVSQFPSTCSWIFICRDFTVKLLTSHLLLSSICFLSNRKTIVKRSESY